MRPMRPDDEHWFTDHVGHTEAQAINRLDARRILDSGISTFYVAVTEDDEPVFMQLLAFPSENDHRMSAWGGMVPPLEPDDAIIDFAFTLEKYRAVGAMPWALARLAEIAHEGGARRLVAWLPENNIAMNRFFRRVGFARVRTRHERYRLGRRRISFEPLRGSRARIRARRPARRRRPTANPRPEASAAPAASAAAKNSSSSSSERPIVRAGSPLAA